MGVSTDDLKLLFPKMSFYPRESYSVSAAQDFYSTTNMTTSLLKKEESHFCHLVGSAFLQGMLLEVCASSKPGLVGPDSCGVHKDMTLLTFASGLASLGSLFSIITQQGVIYSGKPRDLLPIVRKVGYPFEKTMFRFTQGVNTQKGALFLNACVSASLGVLAKSRYPKSLSFYLSTDFYDELSTFISDMCQGLCESELFSKKSDTTRPSVSLCMYNKYGVTGIRGELESGLPSVFCVGLPAITDAFNAGLSLNDTVIHGLVSIASTLEDSTVYNRAGKESQKWLQDSCKMALDLGGMTTLEGKKEIESLCKGCLSKNISPGGSADILSASLGLYYLRHQGFPCKVI